MKKDWQEVERRVLNEFKEALDAAYEGHSRARSMLIGTSDALCSALNQLALYRTMAKHDIDELRKRINSGESPSGRYVLGMDGWINKEEEPR